MGNMTVNMVDVASRERGHRSRCERGGKESEGSERHEIEQLGCGHREL